MKSVSAGAEDSGALAEALPVAAGDVVALGGAAQRRLQRGVAQVHRAERAGVGDEVELPIVVLH